MAKLFTFTMVLFLLGCTASKETYRANPYGNPVVQRSYEDWLEEHHQVVLEGKRSLVPDWYYQERYQQYLQSIELKIQSQYEEYYRELPVIYSDYCRRIPCRAPKAKNE
ncbi:hypothetical protein WDW89_26505 [Deltaproteobacteria bacterium TL4]